MPLADALGRWLADRAPGARVVVLADLGGLLDGLELPGWTLWRVKSNLGFRLDWPQRDPAARHLIIRRAHEGWLADVEAEAAAQGGLLSLAPRELLAAAGGHPADWPAWLDREPALVGNYFRELARVGAAAGAASPAERERIVANALLGFDLDADQEPAVAWTALAQRTEVLAQLAARRCPLIALLHSWLAQQSVPLVWLDPAEPTSAVRLTWLVALLAPHLPEPGENLLAIYPSAGRLGAADLSALSRVALHLQRADRRLAQSQQAIAEATLLGPVRLGLVRVLGLADPERAPAAALAILRREHRCGPLALFALRVLLEAVALDSLPPLPGLETELERLLARLDDFSERRAVRHHAQLLRALLRIERGRAQLAAGLPDARPEPALRWSLEQLAVSSLALLGEELATARRCLTSNSLAEPDWRPEVDIGAHKMLLSRLYQRVEVAQNTYDEFETTCLDAWLHQPSPLDVWDQHLAPLINEPHRPPMTLVLVAGLPWRAWSQHLARLCAEQAECHARPLPVAPPAAGASALLRAAAGRAGSGAWLTQLRAGRPEHAWRRAAKPRAFAPLDAEGCVCASVGADGLRIVAVDLLANAPAGTPTETWQRRVELLGQGLAALSRTRRSDLLVLAGVSGATACALAAGRPVPGEPWSARCVAVDDSAASPPPEVRELRVDGARVWAARGPQRLVASTRAAVMADGGLSLDELVTPLVTLTPITQDDQALVQVSGLAVAPTLPAGQPAQATVLCTLAGGALVELVEARLLQPEGEPFSVWIDLAEPRRLAFSFTPQLPPDQDEADLLLEAELRLIRRTYVRRATVRVRRATPQHESEPRHEPSGGA